MKKTIAPPDGSSSQPAGSLGTKPVRSLDTSATSVLQPRRVPTLGVVCGLASVVGYTLANLALRSVAHCDPAWVSAMKAVPTLLVMGVWLIALRSRGVRLWPDRRGWLWLLAGALAGQFGGNWAFQWSLGAVGLAYAVPLSTGAMILSSGILGRLFLQEALTPRTLLSMSILIAATTVLSLGARSASNVEHLPQIPADASPDGVALWLIAGAAAALFSGPSYALLGVAIRRNVTQQVPIASVMFVVALSGVLCMGAASLFTLGYPGITAIAGRDYLVMLAAGVFTTGAFVCLTIALRETSVTYVNSLGAAQVAASSTLGYFLFGEPFSWTLCAGVALTVLGLWLLPTQPRASSRR